tara:strand:- start:108 stop:1025 length:918 start_codon:yes stop_codon:yes gene_type:complete
MSALVISETIDGIPTRGDLSTITAAKLVSNKVDLAVIGNKENSSNIDIKEVEKIISITGETDGYLAENIAPSIVELSTSYSHIMSPSGTFGKNLLPRISALLDVQQISDVIEIIDSETFVRPIYAGNALATVSSIDEKKVLTIRSTSFEPVAMSNGSPIVIDGPQVQNLNLSRYIGTDLTESDRPELTAARIVVSGGRGLGSAENFSIVETLADKLGAAVGASRAAVDSGFVSNDYQVGQTGKVVAPELYIAVGISGAIQHLAGMKDSKFIVAINKDSDAPIFQIADYGIVGDLFKVVPELSKNL